MTDTVVYHKDADGYCSAAIAKMAGIKGKYIPMNYGEQKDSYIVTSGTVYMLDYSLQPFHRMEALNKICELYWIDHHKTAINNAVKANFIASGGQSLAIPLAACELTWLYFHPDDEIPLWVKLVGRYDVWDHSDIRTLPFHYGLLSYELDPNTDEGYARWLMFKDIPNTQIEEILMGGDAIQRYVKIKYEDLAKTTSFGLRFEGLNFIAFNQVRTGSKIADSIWNPEVYDAILTFGWVRDHWAIGLYTDKLGIDVSTIAVKYGGGGHKGAAGFQCDELPWTYLSVDEEIKAAK